MRSLVCNGALALALVTGCGSGDGADPSGRTSTPTARAPEPCRFNVAGEWNGGACAGDLPIGMGATRELRPRVVYRISEDGWTNVKDYPGNYVLLPPGGDVPGINAGTSDYLAVFTSVYPLRRRCATEEQLLSGQPRVERAAAGIAHELSDRPGVVGPDPQPVEIGTLKGFLVDLRIERGWTGHCFFDDRPTVPMIGGLPPSELIHVLQPGFSYRYYFLDHRGSTLAIEIQDTGRDDLDAYHEVVETFRFG
jgi:hypothetical protein